MPGFYGPTCAKECRISFSEELYGYWECNSKTGIKQCKTGWYGTNCSLGKRII